MKNKFKNKKIEQFDLRYFYIRNFEIPIVDPHPQLGVIWLFFSFAIVVLWSRFLNGRF